MASFSGLFGSGFRSQLTPEQLRALQMQGGAKQAPPMQAGAPAPMAGAPLAMQSSAMTGPSDFGPEMATKAMPVPGAPGPMQVADAVPTSMRDMGGQPQRGGGLFGAGWRRTLGDWMGALGAGMQGNAGQYMEQREGRMRRERMADWARTQKDPMAQADPEAAFENELRRRLFRDRQAIEDEYDDDDSVGRIATPAEAVALGFEPGSVVWIGTDGQPQVLQRPRAPRAGGGQYPDDGYDYEE